MADLKISQLPAATTPVVGTEVLPIVQSGTTSQVSINSATGITRPFTANGVVYASSTSALATGSALVFDGTNLGLGVTPSVGYGKSISSNGSTSAYWSIGGKDLATNNGNSYYGFNAVNTGAFTWSYQTSQAATLYQQNGASSASHQWYVAPSGTAGNAITFTQAMTLDASGNLGIGATSIADANLQITKTGFAIGITNTLMNASFANAANTTGITFGYRTDETTAVIAPKTATGNLAFYNYNGGWSETARFTNTGNLLVGTASSVYGTPRFQAVNASSTTAIFQCGTNGANNIISWMNTASGTRYHMAFGDGTTYVERGYISTNGTVTVYSTTSDYRLKENIQPMIGALEKVIQLKPCTYTWKEAGSEGQGFIAHELQAVVPDAVIGDKDAVNKDGSIRPQAIDTGFLVATLTAAIQEQQVLIESLTTRLAALEKV